MKSQKLKYIEVKYPQVIQANRAEKILYLVEEFCINI